MADKDPPSPEREDETLSLRRLRIESAMTTKGRNATRIKTQALWKKHLNKKWNALWRR